MPPLSNCPEPLRCRVRAAPLLQVRAALEKLLGNRSTRGAESPSPDDLDALLALVLEAKQEDKARRAA